MKYLKKFETEDERGAFIIANDIVSYVEETDKVYTKALTKIASFRMRVDYEDFLPIGADLRLSNYGLAFCSTYNTTDDTSVDAVFIDGKPLDLSLVEKYGTKFGSDVPFCKYPLQGQPATTQDGQPIYLTMSSVEITQDGIMTFSNKCDSIYDNETQTVINLNDNTQLYINVVSQDGSIPSGSYPLKFKEVTVQYDWGTSTYTTVYFTCNGQDIKDIPSVVKFDGPIQLYDILSVELYTTGEMKKFDHARWLPYEKYQHYTLTKNVTKIGSYAFDTAWYTEAYGLKEIWYEGTIAEFNAIEKGTSWTGAVSVVHCTDGDLSV